MSSTDRDILARLKHLLGTPPRVELEGDCCTALDLTEPAFPYYGLLRGRAPSEQQEALGLVAQLTGLRRLNLRRSLLRSLPDALGDLTQMEHLTLGSNYLGGLPVFLRKMPRLRYLHASNCDVSEIPEWIGELRELQTLALHKNLLLRELPEALGSLAQLTNLNLYFVSLRKLPDWLFDMRQLTSLTLWNVPVYPESLARLENLEFFTSCGCSSLHGLPEAFAGLPKLRMTRLFQNALRSLPESIGRLTRLEQISLYQNQLTALPESFAELRNLRKLNLAWNQFRELPAWLRKLDKLEWVGAFLNPLERRQPELFPTSAVVDWERPYSRCVA